jgi:hypothetical protein
MRSALQNRGFEQYRKSTTASEENDDTLEGETDSANGSLTIIQLVRSMAGIPSSAIDFPTLAFWDSIDLATYLHRIWSSLDAALKTIDSGAHSIVSWSFYPPAREQRDLLKVIDLASQIAPDLPLRYFTVRPRSPFLLKPKSIESVTFNMIGIVRTHKDLSYGDFLSSLLTPRCSNEQLLGRLDQQIPEQHRLLVQADKETPIPALLTRVYAQMSDDQSTDSRSLSVRDFLKLLESQNNLSGLSDQSLSIRLYSALKPLGKDSKTTLPAGLQKLLDSQMSKVSSITK